MMIGRVHSFESFAAADGAGMRCAVFLSGCPLRCAYCHNPDTWDIHSGKETDAAALVKKISRYKPYFKTSGGVTFSGGEPLLQADFLAETVPLLEAEGIRYILDTSGHVTLNENVKYLLHNAQSILLDIKFPDDASYRQYTGVGIEKTLEMLEYLESIHKETCIRTVIIPGINDSEEMLKKYLSHIIGKTCVMKYELLAFHTMGFHKYDGLGIPNPLSALSALDPTVRRTLQDFVNRALSQQNTLHTTGDIL